MPGKTDPLRCHAADDRGSFQAAYQLTRALPRILSSLAPTVDRGVPLVKPGPLLLHRARNQPDYAGSLRFFDRGGAPPLLDDPSSDSRKTISPWFFQRFLVLLGTPTNGMRCASASRRPPRLRPRATAAPPNSSHPPVQTATGANSRLLATQWRRCTIRTASVMTCPRSAYPRQQFRSAAATTVIAASCEGVPMQNEQLGRHVSPHDSDPTLP
jgi:hypothetical protein